MNFLNLEFGVILLMIKMFLLGLIIGLIFGILLGFIIFCFLSLSKEDD